MLKKLGILSVGCLALMGCQYGEAEVPQAQPTVQNVEYQQPKIKKMPTAIVVCRAKQCAPSKLSMSKEFVYNTLLHMLDSNARKKALICEADANTHACTEEYVSIPMTVGITPAYMYLDDVKITDVSISRKNTSALDLILNWNVSYNGQMPTCRPSKTLLYVKNVNNSVMEDNGYTCKMTTIGSSTIKTLFAIDYIDLDFGYIGGYYSIGVSGPAYGGGSGYMILRLPEDISLDPKDFRASRQKGTYSQTQNSASQAQAKASTSTQTNTQVAALEQVKQPIPNVDTIIKYQHPAKEYTEAKAKEKKKVAEKKKQEAMAVDFGGVKVYPVPNKAKSDKTITAPSLKNALTDYTNSVSAEEPENTDKN